MPRRSARKRITEKILYKSLFKVLWAKNEEVDPELFDCIHDMLIISEFHYFGPRTIKVPKSRDWLITVLPKYDDDRFKSCLRVTRSDFSVILNEIKKSPVFTSSTSNKMIPVEMQLAVTLYRFGCEGTGVSYFKVGQTFGISDCGTIINCTERVIKALLSLGKEIITWPTQNERSSIKQFMQDKLPGCIGYLDGCHIPLFEAPIDDHESYFSRKQLYGIQMQAVCDNDLLFRDVSIGYPASAHDARVFANSPLGQHPENFFSHGEWIATDSAYRLTPQIITPFRENATFGTASQRKKFNKHFSGYRVKIEQAFGILKKVFGSLRSLRIRVDKQDGHRRACEWILACCILYNIIKPVPETIDSNESENETEQELYEGVNCQGGEIHRRSLFDWINQL